MDCTKRSEGIHRIFWSFWLVEISQIVTKTQSLKLPFLFYKEDTCWERQYLVENSLVVVEETRRLLNTFFRSESILLKQMWYVKKVFSFLISHPVSPSFNTVGATSYKCLLISLGRLKQLEFCMTQMFCSILGFCSVGLFAALWCETLLSVPENTLEVLTNTRGPGPLSKNLPFCKKQEQRLSYSHQHYSLWDFSCKLPQFLQGKANVYFEHLPKWSRSVAELLNQWFCWGALRSCEKKRKWKRTGVSSAWLCAFLWNVFIGIFLLYGAIFLQGKKEIQM